MTEIGKPEWATQNRVIALFRDELGYRYLGDWADRDGNSNIEEELLTAYLTRTDYAPAQISAALHKLRTEADNHNRSLYGNNQAVYNLLRYGVPVKIEAGKVTETVHLINWREPEENDFAIAREVTLHGNHERRPDIVLYVNGIAIGVLELKKSRISVGEGIRQNLSNQQTEFNAWFFSTVQFIFAGNDSEGLHYGTILTPEKYFLKWKEDEQDNIRLKLDKYLLKMCRKDRLIELMLDFVLFDAGIKKLPRAHQYFGIKAAQQHVRDHKGGIIWHTQGSGKSIVMVLLAKWILENNPPFGKNANRAIKFFNHCAHISSFIAFIVPRTFKKDSVVNKLHDNFHLEYEELLPENSFEFDGVEKSVPTVFQIWVKKPYRRARVEILADHEDLEFLPPDRVDEADILFQRVGVGAGTIKYDTTNNSTESHFGLKCSEDAEAILRTINWNLIKHNTAGNPSISKSDVLKAYIGRKHELRYFCSDFYVIERNSTTFLVRNNIWTATESPDFQADEQRLTVAINGSLHEFPDRSEFDSFISYFQDYVDLAHAACRSPSSRRACSQ